jgi:hypothetical protein
MGKQYTRKPTATSGNIRNAKVAVYQAQTPREHASGNYRKTAETESTYNTDMLGAP